MKPKDEIEKLADNWSDDYEKGANRDIAKRSYIEGYTKCQEDNKYSEEDMQEYAEFCVQCFIKNLPCIIAKDWFTQFKKK
jgi:hypothetical protein